MQIILNHFNINNMTTQVQNFINLCKGNPVSSIKKALEFQRKSSIDEMMQHYGVSSVDDLAVRISME